MTILLAAGERVPGRRPSSWRAASDIDCSLVDRRKRAAARRGRMRLLRAGTLNLTGPLTITATAAAKDSFLAEMVRLMEAAEGGRVRLSPHRRPRRALYAPVVHLAALLSFLGWMLGDRRLCTARSPIAIAVLIITCPCALGLAVPMVQVVAARRLFEHGIMVKDGSAMERLAEIDTVAVRQDRDPDARQPRLANAATIAPGRSRPCVCDCRSLAASACPRAGHGRHARFRVR